MTAARTRPTITAAATTALLARAEAAAAALGVAVVIAVVNESGVLMGLIRMDDAPLMSGGIAEDKAFRSFQSKAKSPLLESVRLAPLIFARTSSRCHL